MPDQALEQELLRRAQQRRAPTMRAPTGKETPLLGVMEPPLGKLDPYAAGLAKPVGPAPISLERLAKLMRLTLGDPEGHPMEFMAGPIKGAITTGAKKLSGLVRRLTPGESASVILEEALNTRGVGPRLKKVLREKGVLASRESMKPTVTVLPPSAYGTLLHQESPFRKPTISELSARVRKTVRPGRRTVTDAEWQEIFDFAEQHPEMTPYQLGKELADAYFITPSAIVDKFKRLGLVGKTSSRTKAPVITPVIEESKLTRDELIPLLRKQGAKTAEARKQLSALEAEIASRAVTPSTNIGALAKELGVSRSTIQRVTGRSSGLELGQARRARRAQEVLDRAATWPGSQRGLAKELGIDREYLSKILKQRNVKS